MADKTALFALGTVAVLGGIALAKKEPVPPPPPPGKITVHFLSNPEGAAVTLDGIQLGNAPFDLDVSLGEHLATFKLAGYVDATVSFGLTAGQLPFTLTANMTPVPPPPPDAVPVTFISVPAGATILLNGNVIGIAPISLEILFGQYTAIFRLEGYLDTTMSLTLTPQTQPMTLTANLSPVPPPKVWLTWQQEILSVMSTTSATTDKIKALYNRFLDDSSLAILGMTAAEQEALRQNLVNYLQNISYGNYHGPTDLPSLLGPGVFGLTTDQISFVYNGRNNT